MSLTHSEARQIASRLTPEGRAFIDGAYAPATGGATFETADPATGAPVCSVAHCSADDVNRAVAAARRAFEAGA